MGFPKIKSSFLCQAMGKKKNVKDGVYNQSMVKDLCKLKKLYYMKK